MRVFLAAIIWVVLVGGLALYMQSRTVVEPAATWHAEEASGAYALEVTPSFSAEPDPFALDSDAGGASALRVRLNGEDVLVLTETVEGGRPQRVESLKGVVIGSNEFYVEANPPLDFGDRACAVRVRLFEGDVPLADETLWSDAGIRIASTFTVNVTAHENETEDDGHGH